MAIAGLNSIQLDSTRLASKGNTQKMETKTKMKMKDTPASHF